MKLRRLGLITLFASILATGAWAAPTVEEDALKAALDGRPAEAIRILERTGDPHLRWVAGRLALIGGDRRAAARLFAGEGLGSEWGRIDLAAGGADPAAAATLAIAQMDRALAGVHRDAMGQLLVEWAAERTASDPPNAARFLLAAIGLAPSAAVRHAAEDRLFRLDATFSQGDPENAARVRLAEEPDNPAARLRVAISLASRRPSTAAAWLSALARDAAHPDALAAARALVPLDVPDPLVLDALAALGARFPEDPAIARLRLDHAVALAARDEGAGTAALRALEDTPVIGVEALEARATATRDPSARRALWLALASREGASSRGDAARREAFASLIAAAREEPEGEPRRAFAAEALTTPDGAGTAELLYLAIPTGAGRTAALWQQAERFPGGAWCDDLGETLVAEGTDRDVAERFATSCGGAAGMGATTVLAHAAGTTQLTLRPRAGGLDVVASSAKVLRVSQHRVDAEALFRATVGNPLDSVLDAFLLDADVAWDVPLVAGSLRSTPLAPRGGGNLVTLTIRAEDQRATALVPTDPLDVQLLRRGGDVALAVLHRGEPVAGAELLVQDGEGGITRARTDRRGVLVIRDQGTALRIMARKGDALGFAVSDAYSDAELASPAWGLVLWDRGVPVGGALTDVEVVRSIASREGPTPRARGATSTPHLQSHDRRGAVLDDVPVPLEGDVAHVRLFVQGGGSLALVAGEETLATANVAPPPAGPSDARITWEPAAPRPGDPLVVTVAPMAAGGAVGAGGVSAEVTLTTSWSTSRTTHVLGADGARFPIDLTSASAGESVEVTLRLAGAEPVSSHITLASAPLPRAVRAPAVVAKGAPFAVDAPRDTWVRASSTSGGQRWIRAGEPLVLPDFGTWSLCAWADTCGEETPVVVASGPVDAAGRWQGANALSAVTAEGIRSARVVRAGDSLLVGDTDGTRRSWAMVAADEPVAVPLPGAEPLEIAVTGALRRGAPSSLDVGEGLPEGTRLWVFLRDATDSPFLRAPTDVAAPWEGAPGFADDPWAAAATWGEGIAAALLEEEERLEEASKVERVDFGFSGAEEVASGGGLGMSGYGSGGGGGGYGQSGGALGGVLGRSAGSARGIAADAHVVGVHEASLPGALAFDVPGWIGAADLEVIARAPDGRWASRSLRLDVAGLPLVAVPEAAAVVAPESWDGALASLLPLARSLPADARVHALAALAQRDVPEAAASLRATMSSSASSGPGATLARFIRGLPADRGGSVSQELEGLPDLRRAERSLAALRIAGSDPDRARAIAARLVRDPDSPAWVHVRAGLALWVAGAPEDALAALQGDDAGVTAARAVVSGHADARLAPAWWTVARDEAADPGDRALALHALSLLDRSGVVRATRATPGDRALVLRLEPPLAAWRGEVFPRGSFDEPGTVLASVDTVVVGRASPVWVELPPSPVPTRVACPRDGPFRSDRAWLSLPPSPEAQVARCDVHAVAAEASPIVVRWYGPDGGLLATGRVAVGVVPHRESAPTDPMSAMEKLALGIRLGEGGDPAGLALLQSLLATDPLPPDALHRASAALLAGRRIAGDPAALLDAHAAYREHVPDGVLDLDTAAALARAYAATGAPTRAVAATRVVLDARFKEELGAVSSLQASGLGLTALKLLRELVDRYPEGPTVVSARYLAPSMLLQRAEGDGDRLGYTRSSLRHTAAAELAAFLVVHPDAPQAPEAAALLTDALRALGDPARERALAGPLARRYRDGDAAWRLSLADARAHLAAGKAAGAEKILDAMDPPPDGVSEVELLRGRVYEALGRIDDAHEAYARSGEEEAGERLAWLDREAFTLPALLVLKPGDPPVVGADLRPGAEVTVTAIRVHLEAVLLRDGGMLDAHSIGVDGLRPSATRTFRVDATGDVPLPALPDGAYVVTVTAGGLSERMVVVRSDTELVVGSAQGTGTFVHLFDVRGTPLPDAQLWLFDAAGSAGTTRTDGRGAAWVASGAGQLGVLARIGDRYALSIPDGGPGSAPPMEDNPAAGYGDVLEKNARAYDVLFQQDARQNVRADGL